MKKIIFIFLLSSQAFAGTMDAITPVKNWSWVGTISAGPIWTKSGETQTLFLTPDIEKTYVQVKTTKALAFGELFIGVQKLLSPNVQTQLGLAAAMTGNVKLQGVIWDDADPQFNNHSYQYKVSSSRVAVKEKLLLNKGYWLIPWVSASLGVGFNDAQDFKNTPLIFEALPTPNFTNHTKTALAYTLGTGVQKFFSYHWQLGVGYEFADWGKSELGRAFGQTLNSGLTFNHFYTNELLVNITYVT